MRSKLLAGALLGCLLVAACSGGGSGPAGSGPAYGQGAPALSGEGDGPGHPSGPVGGVAPPPAPPPDSAPPAQPADDEADLVGIEPDAAVLDKAASGELLSASELDQWLVTARADTADRAAESTGVGLIRRAQWSAARGTVVVEFDPAALGVTLAVDAPESVLTEVAPTAAGAEVRVRFSSELPEASVPLELEASAGARSDSLVLDVPVPQLRHAVSLEPDKLLLRIAVDGYSLSEAPDEQAFVELKPGGALTLTAEPTLSFDGGSGRSRFFLDYERRRSGARGSSDAGATDPAELELTVGDGYWVRTYQLELPLTPILGAHYYDHATGLLSIDVLPGAEATLRLEGAMLDVEMTAGGGTTASFDIPPAALPYMVDVTAERDGAADIVHCLVGTRALSLPQDSLAAYPLAPSIGVGQPVQIVVASGLTAQPFQYMGGVRVAAPAASGFSYVPESFDIGGPSVYNRKPDGGWLRMNPPGNFLMPDDSWLMVQTADDMRALDFNITPLQGHAVFFEGELFTFAATFSAPGTWPLSLVPFATVERTYYQDSIQGVHYWSDLSNAAGSLVVVTE
jgi:hypothetical protein